MKHIPNIITISRIAASMLLLFTINYPVLFICIFLYAGISDVLDGILARKMKINSRLGAGLDSAADFLLFIIILICMVIELGDRLNHFYPLLIGIAAIRLFSLGYAAMKYHCFLILHTWGNKITGLAIYASIIIYKITAWESAFYIVALIAMLSAIEELIIHITSKLPEPDRKGLFR